MGIGYLKVNVYAENIAQPIENATIEVYVNNILKTFYTNSFGQSEKILIACPDKIYSLDANYNKKVYGTCNIRIRKQGLQTEIIEGIQIFDGCNSIQNVFLETHFNMKEKHFFIKEHTLWEDYPPALFYNGGYLREDFNLSETIIPEFLIVHDGLPNNNSVANYVVPFIDYIKNVACNEIYPTWHAEGIKATIHAITSFVLNRIQSRRYHKKGYNFTVTSSTIYDLCYIHNRNIFEEISRIVDENFYKYIKENNIEGAFFARINDGIIIKNAEWLNKWELNNLANRDYDSLKIINHFYGDDKTIENADAIKNISDYPFGRDFLEMRGEKIKSIQLKLNIINSSYFDIPKINNLNGVFDESTFQSVKIFQTIFNLNPSGKIDFITLYTIEKIYNAVMKNIKFSSMVTDK